MKRGNLDLHGGQFHVKGSLQGAMADSSPWRELAEHFAQIRLADQDKLFASSTIAGRAWNAKGDRWYLGGLNDPRVHALFAWGAERAAVLLEESPGQDALQFWLDRLRLYSPHYQPSKDNAPEIGFIRRVCLASQEYCFKLETEHIAAKRFADFEKAIAGAIGRSDSLRAELGQNETVMPAESLAAQLLRLRDECRITTEQLAELVGVDSATAYRHLRGVSRPQIRKIGKYEKVFSKLLNRRVVISISPSKRK
jgi:hypothetical protein